MIVAEGLTRAYGGKVALRDLDLRVEPGEILGFLGPNGAGKSTTVKILTGMLKPTAGRAAVAGFDVLGNPLEVKRRIGYVPETGALYDNLSASEYLELVASLHHLQDADKRIAELLDLFGLADVRHQRMTGYSKGMRQKVVIAAALIHAPDVLFLDEPLTGLDANAAMLIKELLRGLAAQGKTILFCSHILEVVERVCTRIVIIDRGRKVVEGTVADITRQTGAATLEAAFSALTSAADVSGITAELLSALEKA